MSIAEKLTQLDEIRTDIRTALATKDVEADTHDFADFAEDIGSIETGGGLPEKGFVLENYNADGYPTTCRLVGNWTEIPANFLAGSATSFGVFFHHIIGKLEIPNTVLNIGAYAFRSFSFGEIVFKSSLNSIGRTAFQSVRNLTKVIFEKSVCNISESIFKEDSVTLYDFSHHTGTVPTLYSVGSLGHASGCVIKVPQSLLTEWQSATNWADLTDVDWQGV